MKAAFALMLLLAAGQGFAAELDRTPLEATTVDGKKVRLFPNGRWEFVDAAMAAEAQKVAAEFPENKARPAEAQGGQRHERPQEVELLLDRQRPGVPER